MSIEFTDQLIATIAAAIFTVAYAYTAKLVLTRSRAKRQEKSATLNAAISQGLSDGSIASVEDLINIYKGVHGLGSDDASHKSNLAKVLREYVVQIVKSPDLQKVDKQRLKGFVTALLKEVERSTPYAALPAAERNLILDVEQFMSAGNAEAATRKLQELAGLVEVRQDALERVQASNKWSVPLAFIGLVLTIVFGVISLWK